jgi:hypothetical protein
MVLETRLLLQLFVLAYAEIYVFKNNPFQAHRLEQRYIHKNNLKKKNVMQHRNIIVKIVQN